MVEVISSSKVRARKEHRCSFCGFGIIKGEVYHKSTLKCDEIYTWKSHLHCDRLVEELRMNDDYGEGISEQDFHDYVWEFFREFNPGYKQGTHTWEEALLFALSAKGLIPQYYINGVIL